MQLAEKSSQVRQKWSEFVDDVIHKTPKFVQRNERDVFMALNLEYMSALLEHIRFFVQIEHDPSSNEYVATMDHFWFVETGETESEALDLLAAQLLDYTMDYFKDFNTYYQAPNLKPLLPYVTKALVTNHIEGLKQYFDVQYV